MMHTLSRLLLAPKKASGSMELMSKSSNTSALLAIPLYQTVSIFRSARFAYISVILFKFMFLDDL